MKKVICFALVAMLTLCVALPSFAAGKDYRGDINMDGDITLSDAMLCFQYVAKKITVIDDSKFDIKAADIDGNENIELSDAMKIFQHVAKKITEFEPLVTVD